MELILDLNSESVTYEDIGAKPRQRRARRRRGPTGPRRSRPLPQDPKSRLKRKRTNLRNGIKRRLDGIRNRSIPANRIGQARQEMRSMFADFKRVDARYKQFKEREKETGNELDKPQRSRTRSGNR